MTETPTTHTQHDTTSRESQLLSEYDKVMLAIEYIENKTKPETPTFLMYNKSEEEFKKLPTLTMMINNQPTDFLVDPGATISVIKQSTFAKPPKKSGRTCRTIGPGGILVQEPYTTPLSCTPEGRSDRKSVV